MSYRNRLFQCLALGLILIAFAVSTTQAQKRRPRSVSSGPPFLELSASPNTIRVCPGEVASVQLRARATSQSGSPLRYKWATDGGRLNGDGANTTWDLSGMQPGVYRATLEVDSGTDNTCAAFSSAAVIVAECPALPPSCPTVSISCPDTVAPDQPVTFSANVSGGAALLTDYNWTVTGGRIIEGQGTRTIRVDTVGLGGQSITANLDVRAGGLNCPASCAVQIPIPRLDCRKFDEFPKLPRNEEKARLDNFAIDLQNTPGSTAYVVVYPARDARQGEVEQHTNRIVDYLVSYRGIDAGRIVKLIGPVGPALHVVLWTCPPGVRPSGLLRE
jgi:hypothetical protein